VERPGQRCPWQLEVDINMPRYREWLTRSQVTVLTTAPLAIKSFSIGSMYRSSKWISQCIGVSPFLAAIEASACSFCRHRMTMPPCPERQAHSKAVSPNGFCRLIFILNSSIRDLNGFQRPHITVKCNTVSPRLLKMSWESGLSALRTLSMSHSSLIHWDCVCPLSISGVESQSAPTPPDASVIQRSMPSSLCLDPTLRSSSRAGRDPAFA